jgi:phage protein D
VGRYYGDGYTRLSTGQFTRLRSDWDLVVELARENQFDAFVLGTQLFFQPSQPVPSTFTPLTPRLVQTLRFKRSLALASDATARVQSWNSQNMAAYDSSTTAGSSTAAQTSIATGNQPYLFSAANFNSEQVTQTAARYTAEINRLRTTLLMEMPWDLLMLPRGGIMLTATGSLFDGLYMIDSVERHYSSSFGSRQTVKAVSVAASGET